MIVDLMNHAELKQMSTAQLTELRDSIVSVLQKHQNEEADKHTEKYQQREANRIFENTKQNAIKLGKMMGSDSAESDIGFEIKLLLDGERYADVIEKVAQFDFERRDRPNFDESRYTTENQEEVRALLIFENMKTRWLEPGECKSHSGSTADPIDVEDAFNMYSVDHKSLIPFLLKREREISDKTVQKYLHDMDTDQERNRDLFFQVIMEAEKNGGPMQPDYTFIHPISEEPHEPLPFQRKRVKAERDKKGPVRKLKDIGKPEVQRGIHMASDVFPPNKMEQIGEQLMAEKDAAVKNGDYDKAADLRKQLIDLGYL